MKRSVETGAHRDSDKKSLRELILIIDDCPDTLEINRTILEMEGYEVAGAESGKEALALLSQLKRPDLILLDMTMREMSGLEFLTGLESERPEILFHVPIVILSGVEVVPESLASGFIRKPVPLDEFLTAVRHYIDKGVKKGRYKH